MGWLSVTSFSQRTQVLWFEQPDLMQWLERSRLNLTRGLSDRAADPQIQPVLARVVANMQPAIENLEKLLAQTAPAYTPA